jgi:hypothetical protein
MMVPALVRNHSTARFLVRVLGSAATCGILASLAGCGIGGSSLASTATSTAIGNSVNLTEASARSTALLSSSMRLAPLAITAWPSPS